MIIFIDSLPTAQVSGMSQNQIRPTNPKRNSGLRIKQQQNSGLPLLPPTRWPTRSTPRSAPPFRWVPAMRTIGVTTGELVNTSQVVTLQYSCFVLIVPVHLDPRDIYITCLRENSGAKTWLNQIKAQKQTNIYGKYQSACNIDTYKHTIYNNNLSST